MKEWFDILVALMILMNFMLLNTSRLMSCIRIVAIQAVILSVMALMAHVHAIDARLVILLLITVSLKAVVLPLTLKRVTIETGIERELEPFVGYSMSLVIGGGMLAVSFFMARYLALPLPDLSDYFLPASLFTIFTGLFMIIARKKAVTQVMGYMAMENGIYAFGVALAIKEPFIVEVSVLLDVFVAVLIMGVAIFHISHEFDHIDTDQMSV
jgi:hydrogenase-4 component E